MNKGKGKKWIQKKTFAKIAKVFWWAMRDSNPRPPRCKRGALNQRANCPNKGFSIRKEKVVGNEGFEPPTPSV